jgi:hypothetical protein
VRAIQYTCLEATAAAAGEALGHLRGQGGYLGGRVLGPSPARAGHLVQAIFEPDGEPGGWLPDGCRHVVVPASLARLLGMGAP